MYEDLSAADLRLRKVNHIGIPVTNLDRSIAFYSALTGTEPSFVNEMHGEGLSQGAEVENARLRFAMIEIGNLSLELLEYKNPRSWRAVRSTEQPHRVDPYRL